MKERIQKIMKLEGMAQNEFAAAIGISASTMSNILTGKSEVSQKVVNSIHRRFPNISVIWLMYGEGEMLVDGSAGMEGSVQNKTVSQEENPAGSLSAASSVRTESSASAERQTYGTVPQEKKSDTDVTASVAQMPKIIETIKYVDKPQRHITEIRVFYSDGTYESFVGYDD